LKIPDTKFDPGDEVFVGVPVQTYTKCPACLLGKLDDAGCPDPEPQNV